MLILNLEDFGESPDISEANISNYLQSLPLPYSFVIAAKINLLTSDAISQLPNDQHIVVNLLHKDGWFDKTTYDEVITHLNSPIPVLHQNFDNYYSRGLFGRAQMLELMRMLAILGMTFTDEKRPSNGRAFLQVSLAATELYANRRRPTDSKAKPTRTDDQILLEYMRIIRSGRVLASPNRDVLFGLARCKLLLQDRFFVDFPKYRSIFTIATGLELEDYINCLVCLISAQLGQIEDKEKFTTLDRVLEGKFDAGFNKILPEKLEAVRKFFALEGQSLDEMRNSFIKHGESDLSMVSTFRTFRDRPIFLTGTGRFIPIDQGFIIDKACIGPIFHMLGKTDANVLFQDFGKSFENYVAYLLASYCELSAIDGAEMPQIASSPFAIRASQERVEIADVAITYKDALVLVESKAVWLPDALMHVDDAENFKREVLKRYGCNNENNEKVKGVAQLARRINELVSGTAVPESTDLLNDKVQMIFPVLFVHDPNLSAPFFGEFLAGHFMQHLGIQELPISGFVDINGFRIFSLFLITADDFELFLEYGKQHRFCDWLQAYSRLHPTRFESCGAILAQAKEKTDELRSPISRAIMAVLETASHAMFGSSNEQP